MSAETQSTEKAANLRNHRNIWLRHCRLVSAYHGRMHDGVKTRTMINVLLCCHHPGVPSGSALEDAHD